MTRAAQSFFRIGAITSMAMLALVVIALGSANAATPAPQCEPQVKAHAQAGGYIPKVVKEQLAKMRAVSKWRDMAEDTYGPKFNRWSQAQDKSVRCDVALGKAHCIAKASPCRSALAGTIF